MLLLSTFEIETILKARKRVRVSFDLGVSYSVLPVRRVGEYIIVGNTPVRLPDMKRALRGRKGRVFRVEEGHLIPLAVFANHFYQLVQPRRGWPPTLEIDGIHMHRIKDVDPLTDARQKVEALRLSPDQRVLDICTGLGYTAKAELENGAEVLSIEKDKNVITLAKLNPWVSDIWERAEFVLSDATEFVKELEDASFDRVLHDPPRFALAGELYSGAFYRELYRVLKPKRILYHYVGEPGKKSGKDFTRGIMRRLRDAGFSRVFREEKTKGVVAVK